MKTKIFSAIVALMALSLSLCAQNIDQKIPVRGLSIAAPSPRATDRFVTFIQEELVPAKINLLILRVDWDYAYETHPELRDSNPLSKDDVAKIVKVCKDNGIRLVPQINLLGHQSWATQTHALLRAYPQFDETPEVDVANYSHWPNADGLYCKSYCPLHPDVHKIVFDVVDEICDVFEADAFHAGMDEVFYIGEDQCPRCKGKDKSVLFADEVTLIHDHLAESGRELMIWGDRLLDGRTTGLGEWEASYNDTWRAVDLIPKDVLICDWHYHRPGLTAAYFATKGLPVVSCGYNRAEPCVQQIHDIITLRDHSSSPSSDRLQGYVHTIWSSCDRFLQAYYGESWGRGPRGGGQELNPAEAARRDSLRRANAERRQREQNANPNAERRQRRADNGEIPRSDDAEALKVVLKEFREMAE